MLILKTLTEETKRYLPTVDIGYYKSQGDSPVHLIIRLAIQDVPTDAELDLLRLALKKWSADCGYGKLAQQWYTE